jgi:hypothetical protein
MDIKEKQRAVIEFRCLEECVSEEVLIGTGNLYGSTARGGASGFRWIRQGRCSNGEPQTKDATENPIDTKRMRSSGQVYKKTRMPR